MKYYLYIHWMEGRDDEPDISEFIYSTYSEALNHVIQDSTYFGCAECYSIVEN